jgi:hypothetical protein
MNCLTLERYTDFNVLKNFHWSYKISGRTQDLSFPQFIRLTFHTAGVKGTVIWYEISGQFETKILRQK